MRYSVAGKVVLVTGPARGIGAETARQLAARGARLSLVGLEPERLAALEHLRRSGASAIEPRAEAQSAYVAEVERRTVGTVWVTGGCASWYLDSTGRNSTLWPDFSWRFRRRVARLDPDEYVLSFRREAAPSHARASRISPLERTEEHAP